jgi:WD40 repeat protein
MRPRRLDPRLGRRHGRGTRKRFTADDAVRIDAWSAADSSARIAAATRDGQIPVWDLATRKWIALLTGHTDAVRCLAPIPSNADPLQLVSGGVYGAVLVWAAGRSSDFRLALRPPPGNLGYRWSSLRRVPLVTDG